MRRREFIALLAGAAALRPLAAHAQADRVRRVGVLMNLGADDAEGQARLAALLQGLQEAGWVVGRNLRIEIRWGAGDADNFRKHAAELVSHAPDVLFASGIPAATPLLQATRTVPIVFAQVVDPVGAGLVTSLARPGGNATGFTFAEYGIGAKWVEFLKEIGPAVTRVAVLRDANNSSGIGYLGAIQSAAASRGMEVTPVGINDAGEIERGIRAFAPAPNGGLIVTGNTLTMVHRELIITLAGGTGFRRFMAYPCLSTMAAYCPTARIRSIHTGGRPAMSIASSKAKPLPSFRCKRRPNSFSASTSRPQKRSESLFRKRCLLRPIK
jgi:putative tryptophan/tyrosine transport system substrate-binding protein